MVRIRDGPAIYWGVRSQSGGGRPKAASAHHPERCESDKRDARTLAQLLRADPRLLSPIEHRAEKLQTDLTVIRMRIT